jgi:hypothetical protein
MCRTEENDDREVRGTRKRQTQTRGEKANWTETRAQHRKGAGGQHLGAEARSNSESEEQQQQQPLAGRGSCVEQRSEGAGE